MIVSDMSKTNCDIHRESNYVKAQENFWEVEMTAANKAFYNDQKDEYNNSVQEMLIQNGVQDKKGGRNDGNKAELNHTTQMN